MKRFIHFVLVISLAVHTAPALAACSSMPGADQIWSKVSVHWVFIGEIHGSNEAPAAFLNLVCDALAQGKSVTVALERPTSEQAAIDGVLSSRKLPTAQKALLNQPDWKDGMDGRASEAMLRLLIALRELRKSYPGLGVAAFDAPTIEAGSGARDEAMGKALLAIGAAKPKNLILILTGNIHAMEKPQFGYDLAAMYLPPQEILSLEVTDRGGEAWSTSGGACGPSKGGVPDKDATRPYGIFLDPKLARYGKVDGILALGVPLTPSAPAAGDPSPLPTCRSKFLSEHPATN
jgi:hypothetical protein